MRKGFSTNCAHGGDDTMGFYLNNEALRAEASSGRSPDPLQLRLRAGETLRSS